MGVDKMGRLQYRYSPLFVERQQRRKYDRIIRFGERLSLLRRATNHDIYQPGWPKARVVAVMLRLINELYFRVGSEKSARQYRTYGITTLRSRHLQITPRGELIFKFVGQTHIRHRRVLVDSELADLMEQIKSIRGPHLFSYLDEHGEPTPVKPGDLNRYITEHMGTELSAKDFRTWAGTVQAAEELAELGPATGERDARRRVAEACRHVAEHLGNTPATCRSAYIHPDVLANYASGVTMSDYRRKAERIIRRCQPDYGVEELALHRMLRGDENESCPLIPAA